MAPTYSIHADILFQSIYGTIYKQICTIPNMAPTYSIHAAIADTIAIIRHLHTPYMQSTQKVSHVATACTYSYITSQMQCGVESLSEPEEHTDRIPTDLSTH